jgi:hypothetical protein
MATNHALPGAQAPACDHAVDLSAIPWDCPWALIDEYQVAAVLGQAPKTLRNYRMNNVGPKYLKLNGYSVRYRIGDLQRYIDGQPSGGGGKQERRGPGRPRKNSGVVGAIESAAAYNRAAAVMVRSPEELVHVPVLLPDIALTDRRGRGYRHITGRSGPVRTVQQ